MNGQIKEIALRLRGLRDMFNISVDEIATSCKVSVEEYEGYESGKNDIPIGILEDISKKI